MGRPYNNKKMGRGIVSPVPIVQMPRGEPERLCHRSAIGLAPTIRRTLRGGASPPALNIAVASDQLTLF